MSQLADPLATASQLSGDLAQWLPNQRWFSAKGRGITTVSIATATQLHTIDSPEPVRLDHVLVEVSYADASPVEWYQVLLGYRRQLPERLEHVRIGELRDPDQPMVAFDALWDTELATALLRLIASGARRGDLRFGVEEGTTVRSGPGDAAETGLDVSGQVTSRVVDAEQSNSSVVFNEAAILKLFRRIVPGQNPDLELARALRRVGCGYVPTLLGEFTGTLSAQPPGPAPDPATTQVSYGMLTEYAVNSADGWSMASASVRDLMAEEDLRADEVGGDFAAESYRLGEAVAAVHADLARALGTGTLDLDGLATVAGQMEARLATAIDLVPDLEPYEDALQEAYAALAAAPAPVPIQRLHGDLHLGQVLRTPTTWLLIDFEGEPIKPLAERIRQDSPLRDVAGMLRSFEYAAAHLLLAEEREAPLGLADDHDAQLRFRTEEWITRNRDAFCDGYAAGAGADPREDAALLRAYELDKAVYETVYETRNRPQWLPIPLHSIERLIR
ncbi:MAG: maltokinase N-terminal cap-like domain-containing protein [Micromonosporaceae bacterium]